MSIIKEMRQSARFTSTEQQIIDYILKNPEELVNLNASTLALVTLFQSCQYYPHV